MQKLSRSILSRELPAAGCPANSTSSRLPRGPHQKQETSTCESTSPRFLVPCPHQWGWPKKSRFWARKPKSVWVVVGGRGGDLQSSWGLESSPTTSVTNTGENFSPQNGSFLGPLFTQNWEPPLSHLLRYSDLKYFNTTSLVTPIPCSIVEPHVSPVMLSPCDQGQWHSYAWSKRILHPTQYAVKAGPVNPRRRCFCNKRCQSAEHAALHNSGVEPNCKGCSWLFCSAAFYPQPFSHCCWAGWAILLKRRSALEHGFGHFSVKWSLVRFLGKMEKEATHWSYFENSGIWIWAKIKSHWFWHSYQYTVMHWYVVVLWSFSLD